MKNLSLAFFATIMLTACSNNIDGTYTAIGSTLFGLAKYKVTLIVDNGEAKIVRPDGNSLTMQSTIDNERLIVFKENPNDGLVFHIKNNGNTLECNQCEQVGIPSTWEKVET